MATKQKSTSSQSPTAKRQRLSPPQPADQPNANDTAGPPEPAQDDALLDEPVIAPDAHINPTLALQYWSSTPATVSGVLGGFPGLSRTDIQGSANFLTKLRRITNKTTADGTAAKSGDKLGRVVDCGAGIGRISVGLLSKVAKRVDVVEPVGSFCDVVRQSEELAPVRGRVWEIGLAEWDPGFHAEANGDQQGDQEKYDLIWNQWCLGQLNDKDLVAYLARSMAWLQPGGLVVVKENLSNDPTGADIYDETDSSVTRTKEKFERIFEEAGLRIVKTELQRGFPRELYPVRSWGLQPV